MATCSCNGCGDDFEADEVEESEELYDALGIPEDEVYCATCLGDMFE